MKNHFNLKSLAFYGIAIGSVLLLFKVVSAYGEANLKAPASIQGRYLLSLDQNLPDCLELSDLVLDVQQSGIYLNGSLLLAESDARKARAGEKRPTLTGKLSDRALQLAGNVPLAAICRQPVAAVVDAIAISSQIQPERLVGKLSLGTTAREIAFTAKRLESDASNSGESGAVISNQWRVVRGGAGGCAVVRRNQAASWCALAWCVSLDFSSAPQSSLPQFSSPTSVLTSTTMRAELNED